MAAESSVGPALPARPAAPEVVPDDGTATVDRTATNDATTQPSPTGGNGEDVVAPQSMPAPRAPGNEPPAVTPTRVRSRLARFGTRPSTGSPVLEPLLAAVRANQPKADVGLLERAYTTAANSGSRTGDPVDGRVPKRTNRDRTRVGVTAGGSFPGARGAGMDCGATTSSPLPAVGEGCVVHSSVAVRSTVAVPSSVATSGAAGRAGVAGPAEDSAAISPPSAGHRSSLLSAQRRPGARYAPGRSQTGQ